MIKEGLQKIVNSLGYKISKFDKNTSLKKSFKSNALSLFETKTGKYFLPTHAHQDVIAIAIKQDKIFDEPILEIAKKYIKSNTIVLDVGSNFGQMAILMSQFVGNEGYVYAFEADDFVFDILEKNVAENSAKVKAVFGAVHDKSNETLYFPVQDFEKFGTYGSYGIDYVNGKGRPVKTIKIDDIEFEKPVSFMKIDVHGGDLFALKGAVQTIKKYKMPIIFEYEYSFEDDLNLCFQDYVDFVNEIGYKFSKVSMGQNYLILPK